MTNGVPVALGETGIGGEATSLQIITHNSLYEGQTSGETPAPPDSRLGQLKAGFYPLSRNNEDALFAIPNKRRASIHSAS